MEYNVAKIRDKIRIYEKSGKETSTFFLTPAEIQECTSFLKNVPHTINGGFTEAERRIIIVGNEYANINNYLTVIRITSSNKDFTHRSVLGSILGLGIKREMIGDLVVKNQICDIIIVREMRDFIINNFRKVGNEKIDIKEVTLGEVLTLDDEKEIRQLSVASLRLDAIVSGAFGIAREKSNILVQQEKVLINFLPCLNNSKAVKENDLISVRGHGRIKVVEIVRRNKKGKNENKSRNLLV